MSPAVGQGDLGAVGVGMNADTMIPVLSEKFARGWPEHERGLLARYMSVAHALTAKHTSDAHFATYSVPEVPRRLASPLVFERLPKGVRVVLFVVDVDDPDADAARDVWWLEERAKLQAMLTDHGGGYIYRTRGGYRIVYRLATPFVLTSQVDAERWKRTYLAWLGYVRDGYGIHGDEACKDWTRLYRLPHVKRDGQRREYETIGDPNVIGLWDVEAVIVEPQTPAPRKSAQTTTKPGAFDIRAAIAANYPGTKTKNTTTAENFYIECPWKHEHSVDSGESETVVFVYPDGAWEFKCLHAHCANRDHVDFRQWLDPNWKPFDPNQAKPTSRDPLIEITAAEPAPTESYAPDLTESERTEAEEFVYGKNGIIESQANVMLALRKLGVTVVADEFARHELIRGLKGFGPRVDDAALRELRLLIDERFTFRLQKEFFVDVVSRHAWRNRFHPVREYLAGLTWDGRPRIDRWLIDLAGAPDTSYVLAISRLVLVAAVRRIRQPGCKFDEMVILESAQGTNKSSALKILAVRDEWFADDLPLDGDTKKLIEQTGGKWIVEAGELKGMSRGDVAQLKACLSRQVDEARLSYDRKPTIASRQFVIIGTTNETEGYLKDTTGNRRFWPVLISGFDLGKLAAQRDQLWAEAAHVETQGESIRLDPALYTEAAAEQGARENDDPIEIALTEALGDRLGKVRALDLWDILNVEPGKATQDQNARLGAAMRRLGWERTRRRVQTSDREYVYVKGTEYQRTVWITVDVVGAGDARRVRVGGGA